MSPPPFRITGRPLLLLRLRDGAEARYKDEPNLATVEHLDSRLSPLRGAFGGGNTRRRAIACLACNSARGARHDATSPPAFTLRAAARRRWRRRGMAWQAAVDQNWRMTAGLGTFHRPLISFCRFLGKKTMINQTDTSSPKTKKSRREVLQVVGAMALAGSTVAASAAAGGRGGPYLVSHKRP